MRYTWLPLLILAATLACSPSLEQCATKEVNAMTPSELAVCYELAEDWEAQPTEELQQSTRALLQRIPAPTPVPTPEPPTETVGFIEFQHHSTQLNKAPAEITWFRVVNTSGVNRKFDPRQWAAKDSNGNEYGLPFFSIIPIPSPMVTWEPAKGSCWGEALFEPRLKPAAKDCRVGFTWQLIEPNTGITEVRYGDVKLPFRRFDCGESTHGFDMVECAQPAS